MYAEYAVDTGSYSIVFGQCALPPKLHVSGAFRGKVLVEGGTVVPPFDGQCSYSWNGGLTTIVGAGDATECSVWIRFNAGTNPMERTSLIRNVCDNLGPG
jgi:hypothetical protein